MAFYEGTDSCSKRVKLATNISTCTYLHACVEEAEREQELLVHGRVAGDAQLAVVQLVVRALQVGLLQMR